MDSLGRASSRALGGFRRQSPCELASSTGSLCLTLRQLQNVSLSVLSVDLPPSQLPSVRGSGRHVSSPRPGAFRFTSPLDPRPFLKHARAIVARQRPCVSPNSHSAAGLSLDSGVRRGCVRSRSTKLEPPSCLVYAPAASARSSPWRSSCCACGVPVVRKATASTNPIRSCFSHFLPRAPRYEHPLWILAHRKMPPGGLDQAREPEPSPSSSPRSPSFGSAHSRFYSSLVSPHLLCSTLSFPPSSSSSPSCLRLPTASGLPTRSADSSPTVCVLRAPGASLSPPSSPSAPASQVPHESLLPRSSFPLGQARDAAFDAFVPGGGLSWLQVRWKKKRGKKEKIILNAEQVATKTKLPPIRLEDRVTPEPPASVARNIRAQISRAAAGWKTKRMFTYRNKYRLRRLVGMTHDVDSDDEFTQANSRKRDSQASTSSSASSGGEFKQAAGVKESSMGRKQKRAFAGRTFVTPLTKLQHQAALPRSPLHARFDFPHTFHYDVFWGPPQVEEEPNKTACWVSFHVADLKLSDSQEQRLLDILGPERYDEQTGIACLEADVFPQLNHNAAYLGDILQQLMREVQKA
uniref:3'-5' exoribonuclease CSL4, related n=1 Tax=Neospora caninum (strain Liverpool) TaxID=572307 RepID=A0A0F7UBC9_NEOCL|nr:TPA: 3'-5' exoribonuclease CSL4, related [Neospora caninum Liverpool]